MHVSRAPSGASIVYGKMLRRSSAAERAKVVKSFASAGEREVRNIDMYNNAHLSLPDLGM